jgi:uncharacterized membrane protein
MEENHETKKLLRSIRNALWLIAAVLLMGLGFHLPDFGKTPIAEILMLLSFWGGFFLFVVTLIGMLAGLIERPNDQPSEKIQHDSTHKP